MTIMPIYLHPHPVLRQKCTPVTAFDDSLKQLADDMIETMQNANGVGLAAPQVGVTQRIFVVDFGGLQDKDYGSDVRVCVNPKILEASEEKSKLPAGCLSIPNIFTDHVPYPQWLKMTYQDVSGKELTVEGDAYVAWGLQHEYDHLEGILFTDYVSRFQKQLLMNKYKKVIKNVESIVKYPVVTA